MTEIAELAKALAAAQGEFQNPQKDRVNPHFKNKYATLDSLQTATRPILAKHGLAVVQLPTLTPSLITRLMHTSGQSIESETPIQPNLPPQQYGSALTYMRRYSLAAILGITADEDDDAEVAAKPPKARPEPIAPARGTSSGRDLATDWVEQQRALYSVALTIDAVDAITAKHTATDKAVASLERLKKNWPDLWTLLEKARLDAEERVIDATQAQEAAQ